jgi:hypothetical protein
VVLSRSPHEPKIMHKGKPHFYLAYDLSRVGITSNKTKQVHEMLTKFLQVLRNQNNLDNMTHFINSSYNIFFIKENIKYLYLFFLYGPSKFVYYAFKDKYIKVNMQHNKVDIKHN